jgi:hypothetical protein
MRYWRDFTGPGRHRINARSLDYWRWPTKKVRSGTAMSPEELEKFRKHLKQKQPTPTELVYRKLLKQREIDNG